MILKGYHKIKMKSRHIRQVWDSFRSHCSRVRKVWIRCGLPPLSLPILLHPNGVDDPLKSNQKRDKGETPSAGL